MLDEISDRVRAYLVSHRFGVLSTGGGTGEWAVLVRYQIISTSGPAGLTVACLLPRWSDVVFQLQLNPRVLLTICDHGDHASRWLQYRGTAVLRTPSSECGGWPARLPDARLIEGYLEAVITPIRIDLVDERRGWGARDTMEF